MNEEFKIDCESLMNNIIKEKRVKEIFKLKFESLSNIEKKNIISKFKDKYNSSDYITREMIKCNRIPSKYMSYKLFNYALNYGIKINDLIYKINDVCIIEDIGGFGVEFDVKLIEND